MEPNPHHQVKQNLTLITDLNITTLSGLSKEFIAKNDYLNL